MEVQIAEQEGDYVKSVQDCTDAGLRLQQLSPDAVACAGCGGDVGKHKYSRDCFMQCTYERNIIMYTKVMATQRERLETLRGYMREQIEGMDKFKDKQAVYLCNIEIESKETGVPVREILLRHMRLLWHERDLLARRYHWPMKPLPDYVLAETPAPAAAPAPAAPAPVPTAPLLLPEEEALPAPTPVHPPPPPPPVLEEPPTHCPAGGVSAAPPPEMFTAPLPLAGSKRRKNPWAD